MRRLGPALAGLAMALTMTASAGAQGEPLTPTPLTPVEQVQPLDPIRKPSRSLPPATRPVGVTVMSYNINSLGKVAGIVNPLHYPRGITNQIRDKLSALVIKDNADEGEPYDPPDYQDSLDYIGYVGCKQGCVEPLDMQPPRTIATNGNPQTVGASDHFPVTADFTLAMQKGKASAGRRKARPGRRPRGR